jgi:hypothetical protein
MMMESFKEAKLCKAKCPEEFTNLIIRGSEAANIYIEGKGEGGCLYHELRHR